MSLPPHIHSFAEQFAEMFTLEKLISRADSGIIYRAVDKLRDIPICLKFYDSYPGQGQRRDWRINATIKSEFLATNFVVLVFRHENRPWVVACLEWIEGPTFEQFAAALSKMHPVNANSLLHRLLREVLAPLAKHLDSLHRRGIGHGDLHAANIKVRVRGDSGRRRLECVIYDFFCELTGEARTEQQLIDADLVWLRQRMDDILRYLTGGRDLLSVVARARTAGGVAFALQTYSFVFFEADGGAFRRSRAVWAHQLSACERYRAREPEMVEALVALLLEVADNASELELAQEAQRCLKDSAYDYRDDNAPQLPIKNLEEALAAQERLRQEDRDATEQLLKLLAAQEE